MYYLYSHELEASNFSLDTHPLKYLKNYLNPEKSLDVSISNEYPIQKFGQEEDMLKISGVKTLLEAFDNLDADKNDFLEIYGNVEFRGIEDGKQIQLHFPRQNFGKNEDGLDAHGIYEFYSDFYDQFGITKYIDYCLSHDYNDLIFTNTTELLSKNAEQEKQFRLLRDKDGTWGIRALTSTLYKNYDNGVVLYLALLSIHKYSVENATSFKINGAYLTDSFMHVFFERADPVIIPKIGKVYLGLSVSNGEIRNYRFKVEMRYRIVNSSDKDMLAAIYDVPLFNIIHNTNAKTIESSLDRFKNLNSFNESIIDFVKNLSEVEVLSEDATYKLLKDLLDSIGASSDISTKTKKNYQEFVDRYTINNTISLFALFGKIQTIKTDMDEKIFVERIFHKAISNLLDEKTKENNGGGMNGNE